MAPAPRTLLLALFYAAILLGVAGLAFALLEGRDDGSEWDEGTGAAPDAAADGPPRPTPTSQEIPLAPAASSDAAGWTVNGTGAAVSCAAQGWPCSVRMAPACCRVRHVAERALDWTLEGADPLNVTFRFRGSATQGDTDAELRLVTDRQHVVLSFTRPGRGSSNNGVTLDGGEPNESLCGAWPRAGEWYDVAVTLEPSHRFVRADVQDAAGDAVAHCAMHYEGDRLLALRVDGVDYGTGLVFDYDALRIER